MFKTLFGVLFLGLFGFASFYLYTNKKSERVEIDTLKVFEEKENTQDVSKEENILSENINLNDDNAAITYEEPEEEIEKAENKTEEVKEKFEKILTNKLLPPAENKIYFGAFPDFGGPEDNVTEKRILDFEKLANGKILWAYFSQNWYNGIKYPKEEIHTIYKQGIVPFVRLMPRSSEEQFVAEKKYSLENIINGKFDSELKQWAKDAKEDNIPLLVDFAVEANGDWFSWSGFYNGKGIKGSYGDRNYYDGPEKYRDAYRHIIDIFRNEGVKNVTWFFHVDIYSSPNEEWNQPKYYYPGDDYIDWIGISIYGPQNTGEKYWETFSEILKNRYKSILDISSSKPFAVLEFGVTDNSSYGKKSEWLEDAFETILSGRYIKFSAVSYWNENWEEEDGSLALIRIDSSDYSLQTFQNYLKDAKFVFTPSFTNLKYFPKNTFKVLNDNKKQDLKTVNIYKPNAGISWQWQLTGDLNMNYDVDLYDIDLFETSEAEIDELHKAGRKVICYFNAGAYEPYRNDSSQFPEDVLGKIMEGWEDEKWLDVSNFEKFSEIMEVRLNLAKEKGCDGVEPDNIDAYQNDTGFDISYNDQLKYNKWIASEAHKRGLSIALKNDLEQVADLVNNFDFAVNEECFQYNECSLLVPFIVQDKAVLGVEYELETDDFCDKANALNFSWLKMDYDLDGGRISCK